MLEVIENALMNPEFCRHFVSEILCFYFVLIVCAASAALIIGILESIDNSY